MPLPFSSPAAQYWGKAVLLLLFITLLYNLLSFATASTIHPKPLSSSWSITSWNWPWAVNGGRDYLRVTERLHDHPIDTLVKQAEARFQKQLKQQSQSLSESVSEYQRRYGRLPPPGFESWYEAAVESGCPIIDDYDAINEALEPFWALSARDIRDRVQAVVESKDWLDVYTVKGHAVVGAADGDPIGSWINSFAKHLPDLQMPYNHLAESRVAVPFEKQQSGNLLCRDEESSQIEDGKFRFQELNRQNTWHQAIEPCPPESAARVLAGDVEELRDLPHTNATQAHSLRFIDDVLSVKNLCNDTDLRSQHGNLISPDTTLLAQELLPVFSRDKLSSFQDILIPTPAYAQQSKGLATEEHVPWHTKKNDLYWSGTTTGGYSHNGTWRFSQRFRFVSLMNDPHRPVSLLRAVGKSGWERFDSTIKSISPLVDVKFTKQKLCTEDDCEAQRADSTIHFGDREQSDEYKKHRLVMDIDGQASTNRYYRLLASGSTVVKQTLMREWHDDRLTPWVHYVPVSMHLEEMAEVVRYLTVEEQGQLLAKKIAEQGQNWWQTALRYEDMRLYMFRLMLEWARLIDPARDEHLPTCEDGNRKWSVG